MSLNSRLPLETRIVAGFAAALVVILLLAGGTILNAYFTAQRFQEVEAADELRADLQTLRGDIQLLQIDSLRHVSTGAAVTLANWDLRQQAVRENLAHLRERTASDPEMDAPFGRIEAYLNRLIVEFRQLHEAVWVQGPITAITAFEAGDADSLLAALRTEIESLSATSRQRVAAHTIGARQAASRTGILLGTSTLAIGLLGVSAIVIVRRDFGRRALARRELEQSSRRVRELYDQAPCGFHALDPDGRFLEINQTELAWLGHERSSLVGKAHFTDLLTPESRSVFAARGPSPVDRFMVTGLELDMVRRDGSILPVLLNASVVTDGAGRVTAIPATIYDMTDRRKLEQMQLQFRSLFEELPGLFLVLTPDLEIVAASNAYLKATLTTRDQLIGRQLFDAFPDNPEDPDSDGVSNLQQSLDRVSQTLEPDTMRIQKYDIRRPDGTFEARYWSPVNSPVLGPKGQLEYIIHRAEDVTDFMARGEAPGPDGDTAPELEQMQAELFGHSREVEEANERLQMANQELEAFSYSVSHDLRAPLRHISGFARLLQKQAGPALDENGRRQLKVINDAALQMGRLIDDLLAFSRISRAALSIIEVDQDALVAGIVDSGEFEVGPVEPAWQVHPLPRVQADPALLRQVWINLISNAVKYSSKSSAPTISIGGEEIAETRETVCWVRDNGVGFDMKYADKLFGVFQRLHGPDQFSGTGIGLANVRRIVLRHAGRVWAESQPNLGATFFFSLPIPTPDSPAPQAKS